MSIEVLERAKEALEICERNDSDLVAIADQVAITPTDHVAKLEEVARIYEQMAAGLVEIADQITIANQADFENSVRFHQGLKGVAKKIEGTRKAMKAPVLDAGRWIDGLFNPTADFVKKAEITTETKTTKYKVEQDRIREEAERRARELAEKERQRQERLAQRAEERGNQGLANQHREEAELIPESIVLPTVTPVKGSAFKEIGKFQVIDPMALIKAVAAGEVSPEAVIPNETYLGQVARRPDRPESLPGVRFYSETIMASRAR